MPVFQSVAPFNGSIELIVNTAPAWQACRAELMARAEVLDWARMIPAPVPDESNFYSAPIVRSWLPNRTDTPLHPIPGSVPEFPPGYFPSWPFAISDLKTLPLTPPADKPEAKSLSGLATWFDRWADGFNELYQAGQRPEARLEGAYTDPISHPIPGYVRVREVAQVLATRAQVHLLQRKPELALRDLDTLQGLIRAMTAKPWTLVSAMIGVAIMDVYANVVQEGLAAELWGPDQLAVLPERMGSMTLLPVAVDSLRAGERAALLQVADALTRQGLSGLSDARGPAQYLVVGGVGLVVPRGWIRQHQVRHAQLIQNLIEPYDAKTGRIDPRRADALAGEIEQSVSARSPFLLLCEVAIPNITKALMVVSRNQTLLRLASIACALERHRLAHGAYPERLEALVPAYLPSVPTDVLKGGSLIYRPTSEGKFLLYSTGWNLKDDGGKGTGTGTIGEPDWVWLTSLSEPGGRK